VGTALTSGRLWRRWTYRIHPASQHHRDTAQRETERRTIDVAFAGHPRWSGVRWAAVYNAGHLHDDLVASEKELELGDRSDRYYVENELAEWDDHATCASSPPLGAPAAQQDEYQACPQHNAPHYRCPSQDILDVGTIDTACLALIKEDTVRHVADANLAPGARVTFQAETIGAASLCDCPTNAGASATLMDTLASLNVGRRVGRPPVTGFDRPCGNCGPNATVDPSTRLRKRIEAQWTSSATVKASDVLEGCAHTQPMHFPSCSYMFSGHSSQVRPTTAEPAGHPGQGGGEKKRSPEVPYAVKQPWLVSLCTVPH
jgi:hypothetical protein